jgi:hypothetical protein
LLLNAIFLKYYRRKQKYCPNFDLIKVSTGENGYKILHFISKVIGNIFTKDRMGTKAV